MKKFAALFLFAASVSAQAQSFTFCAGSCADLRTDESESIFLTIAKEEKQFFLWLGDNLYFKKPDWQNESTMRDAYTKRFQGDAVQMLLHSSRQLAIYDDHDYGPNDSDSTFAGKRESAQVFAEFWLETPTQVDRYHDIRWSERYGDVLMVGLDDRAHRGPVGTVILGKEQLAWLAAQLDANKDASIVFIAVGSQVLNEAEVFENYSRFPAERDELLALCARAEMPVVFLTGDRHHGEINQKRVNGTLLTEITASPLTSTTHSPSAEELKANKALVKNTVVNEAHYARITWTDGERLSVQLVDASGKDLVSKEFKLGR
ncbi:MAG: alkaline phosphatase D family protein [Schleiferiaceae bacterium]